MINFQRYKKPIHKELNRILSLPERNANDKANEVYNTVNEFLKLSKGTMTLRPKQALAIYEAYEYNGALLFFSVGTGKTLITYLIPVMFEMMDNNQRRGVLLVPSRLAAKTYEAFDVYSQHWQNPASLIVVTFESVSTQPEILNEYKPDLLIVDEAHKLSCRTSTITRRVERYLRNNPETIFIAMSGTLVKKSFRDWHHILQWTLPYQLQCLPIEYTDIESWCNALDDKPLCRVALGALKRLGNTRKRILSKLSKRFADTPGVIMCDSAEQLPKLSIVYEYIAIPEIEQYANHLVKTWSTPQGTEFIFALDLFRHLREVSQGFCYEWTKQPPHKWLNARSEYASFVRKKIRRSRTIDTPKQVEKLYKDKAVIKKWLHIKDSFKLRHKAVWFSTELFRKMIVEKRTLIWVAHDTVGKYLENKSSFSYYSNNGKNKYGESIESCESDIAIVSIKSCSEGYNLQQFNHNIVTCSPKLGKTWEQMLGRTHRSGQTQDVTVTVYGTLKENENDFREAITNAEYIQRKTSNEQKLCKASIRFV